MFESLNQGISTTRGILVVVLVAAIAGSGILAYQYYWQPEVEPFIPPIQPPTDETADWLIYKNEEYSFEFKYPEEWYYYNYEDLEEVFSTFSKWKYLLYYNENQRERLEENYGIVLIHFVDSKLDELFEKLNKATQSLRDSSNSGLEVKEFFTKELSINGVKGYELYHSGISYIRLEEGEEYAEVNYLFPSKKDDEIVRFTGEFKGNKSEEYAKVFDKMISNFRFIEEKEKIEVTNELKETMKNEIIPAGFNKEKVDFVIDDLDMDEKPEVIVTTLGYIAIATILDHEGNYQKMAELESKESSKEIVSVLELDDIDNNNQKEIILALESYLGSYKNEGILSWNKINQKLEWIEIKNEFNEKEEAIFDTGGGWIGRDSHLYFVIDLNNNKQKEIIRLDVYTGYTEPDDLDPWEIVIPLDSWGDDFIRFRLMVYQWDGSIFSYSEELSKSLREDIINIGLQI